MKELILLMTIFMNKKVGVVIFIAVSIIGIIASDFDPSNINYYGVLFLYFIVLFVVSMSIRRNMIEIDLQEYEIYLTSGIKNKYIVNKLNDLIKFYDIENNKLY